MHSDEAKLVDLVCKGDQRAYTELVMRHLSSIEVYAKRIVSDEALAQDIAQEVMTVLWQRSSDFNPAKARLTTWLHRIAHNRCVDVLRKRKREVSLDSDEPQREASAPVPSALAQPSIDAGLRRLPESQRTALVLTYYQNLSNREVAEIMNSSVRAVESLLVRARGNLKKQLEAQR